MPLDHQSRDSYEEKDDPCWTSEWGYTPTTAKCQGSKHKDVAFDQRELIRISVLGEELHIIDSW